jgi:hypothetical protein
VLLRWRHAKPKINLLVAADGLDFDDHEGVVKELDQSPAVVASTKRVEFRHPGDPKALATQVQKHAGPNVMPTRTTTASAETSTPRLGSQTRSSNATSGSVSSYLVGSTVEQTPRAKPWVIANPRSYAPPISSGVREGVQPQAPARTTPSAPPLQSREVQVEAKADVPRVVRAFEVKSTPQPILPLVPPLRATRIVRRTEPVQWTIGSIPSRLGLRAVKPFPAHEVAAVERSFPRSSFSVTHDRGWVHLGRCGAAIDLVDRVVFPASCVREHDRGLAITHLHETLDVRSSEVHWFT